eukprot:TRINITY_DN8673_c0_g3_i1.p1 TRINITY_DN8673_c0_g3~~TRINITY_DN8673_c0_g3_i1.p1  ORF type:complete len:179 (+),score=44.36 TRINITY_DN8673_c0_g3_i1:46-582(+)
MGLGAPPPAAPAESGGGLQGHAAAGKDRVDDGLAHAVEFVDPRPQHGGWIRVGHDAAGALRYSCDGALRPPFTQAILTICAGEAYLAFPDISRGLFLEYSAYAAEHVFPALRAMFTEAGVTHNIPDDGELQAYLPCPPAALLSPCTLASSVAPDIHNLQETCRLLRCSSSPTGKCVLM